MTWIQITEPSNSSDRLKSLLATVKRSTGQVDNILHAHSLRPHTLAGHMALYRSVMHHHKAALERLINDRSIAARVYDSLATDHVEGTFAGGALAAMRYVKVLTLTPSNIHERFVSDMRSAGLGDADILEINQVASYFAYANRTALGLGVETDKMLGCESGGVSAAPCGVAHDRSAQPSPT